MEFCSTLLRRHTVLAILIATIACGIKVKAQQNLDQLRPAFPPNPPSFEAGDEYVKYRDHHEGYGDFVQDFAPKWWWRVDDAWRR
jgi:hypothetical protein